MNVGLFCSWVRPGQSKSKYYLH